MRWKNRAFPLPALSLLATLLAAVPSPLLARQAGDGAIRGTVRSTETREPVRGIQVAVRGTGILVTTDGAGRYVLGHVPAGERVVVFRMLGMRPEERTITVVAGSDVTLDLELTPVPVVVGELVVTTASRTPERIVEAPASVTVVEPTAMRSVATTGQPALALAAVPGVDIAQSGVNDVNINARGLNSSLNRRVLVLQDGRDLAIAFLGAPQEWNAMAMPFDEQTRMELVRGPGSALYGANAFAGVLDIRTPAPREQTGTRLSLVGGGLETIRADLRHAGTFSGGRFGYRVSAGYSTSDTWTRSRTSSDSSDMIREYVAATDSTARKVREAVPLNGQTLGTFNIANGDREPLTTTYGSARLDWYGQSAQRVLTAEAGMARVENEVFVTGIGRVQVVEADRPWARLNFATPSVNLMGWYSGRKSRQPQVALASGAPLSEESSIFHLEGQFNRSFGGDRARIVAGGSVRSYQVNTDSTLMEAADDDRSDTFTSLFGQLELKVASTLRAVVAARYDDGSLYEGQFSPKAALVWAPHRDHSIRATVNRAFQTPNYSEFFLRAAAGAPTSSPATLEAGFEQYFAGVNGAVTGGLLPASVTAGLDTGPMPWNFDPQTTVQARGNRDLKVEHVTSWELGYKGNVGRRSFLTFDVFRSNMQDFVTDLLPGVNPAFPTYMLDSGRTIGTVATLDSLDRRLAALGLPAAHPLRAPIPTLRGGFNQLNRSAGPALATLPTGQRAILVSYANAGEVVAQGVELGATLGVDQHLALSGSLTWFEFDVESQALGDRLVANTPEWKATFAIDYSDTRLDLRADLRLVDEMQWAAGVFFGYIPSSQTVNVSGGYRITNLLRVNAVVTNVMGQQRYHMYGGSVIGRRALVGITADF